MLCKIDKETKSDKQNFLLLLFVTRDKTLKLSKINNLSSSIKWVQWVISTTRTSAAVTLPQKERGRCFLNNRDRDGLFIRSGVGVGCERVKASNSGLSGPKKSK